MCPPTGCTARPAHAPVAAPPGACTHCSSASQACTHLAARRAMPAAVRQHQDPTWADPKRCPPTS
eukprot:1252286-Prymnesium_polylepis.1